MRDAVTRDATVPAQALKQAGRNVDAGLGRFERDQLGHGWGMTNHGIALGQRWTTKAR